MAKKEVEAVVEEEAVAEVEIEEELIEKAPKVKEFSKKDANEQLAHVKRQHARVHAILDARYGGDPTVRSFMQLADEIKAILPI